MLYLLIKIKSFDFVDFMRVSDLLQSVVHHS